LRAGRDRSKTDHRQPNRTYLRRIAMQAPDHDAVESSRVGFKDNKIAYAAFVEPSAVVDHQHVARSSLLQRFQEDVDAAGVSSRDYTPGQAASWNNSLQKRGAAAHWGLSANARIRQMGGGQCCKPLPNIVGIHAVSERDQRVSSTTAQASISTRAPSGSVDVAKAVRAGNRERKKSA